VRLQDCSGYVSNCLANHSDSCSLQLEVLCEYCESIKLYLLPTP